MNCNDALYLYDDGADHGCMPDNHTPCREK